MSEELAVLLKDNIILNLSINDPPVSKGGGKFRKISWLVVFSGCLSVLGVHMWAL